MDRVKFNYPPNVAIRYITEWRKRIEEDDKADVQLKKVMEDVATLCNVGVRHLKFNKKTE